MSLYTRLTRPNDTKFGKQKEIKVLRECTLRHVMHVSLKVNKMFPLFILRTGAALETVAEQRNSAP